VVRPRLCSLVRDGVCVWFLAGRVAFRNGRSGMVGSGTSAMVVEAQRNIIVGCLVGGAMR
jgi:hypothetical protein